jgi:hypothetical protein
MQLNSHLHFSRQCEEAFKFYVFGTPWMVNTEQAA